MIGALRKFLNVLPFGFRHFLLLHLELLLGLLGNDDWVLGLRSEASTRCAKMSRRCGRDGGLNGKLGRPGELAPARRGARWL